MSTTPTTGTGEPISFSDVKARIGQHLKTAAEITDFKITFAKLDEKGWRVNVEWDEQGWPSSALLNLDPVTGQVREYRKGSTYRF